MFFKEIQEFTIDSNPKGGKQALSIIIRIRYIFKFSSHLVENNVSWYNAMFYNLTRVYLRCVEPGRVKASALY